jgi:hypothetical protein
MQNNLSHSIRFSYSIYLIASISLVGYFQIKGLGNDFPTFFKAGEAVRTFSDPWQVNEGSQFNAYLNGPLTGLLLGLLSFLPYSFAMLSVRILTLAVIPYAVESIAKLSKTNISVRDKYFLSSLLLFTFPVRANLEYGQLAIIFSAVGVAALRLIGNNKSSKSLFWLGFISIFLVDYKPQVFIPILFIVLLLRKSLFAGIFFGIVLMVVTSWLLSRTLLTSWTNAMFTRSGQISSGDDQMSLYSFFSMSKELSYLVAATLSILLCLRVYRIYVRSKSENQLNFILVGIGIWSAISPFSHPTDMFFSILIGSMYLYKIKTTALNLKSTVLFSAAMVWSNNLFICIAIGLVVSILSLSLKDISGTKLVLFGGIATGTNLILPIVVQFNSTLETNVRQAFNYLCVAVVAFIQCRKTSMTRSKRA